MPKETTFSVSRQIARRILDGLRLELSDKEQETLGRRPTENAEAYEEFLRGRDNFARFIFRTVSNDDCEAAINNFKHAVELDTHFALAYSGLGACYANRVFKGLGDPEDYTYAEAAFSKAFKYDPNVSEARVLMVMIYMARGEKKKARSEIELLKKQFPNEPPLYFVKGVMHRLDGEYDESLKSFEKLARLDPAASVISSYNRARIFLYRKNYEKALAELDRGAKQEPHHPLIRVFRSAILFYMGQKTGRNGFNRRRAGGKSADGRHSPALCDLSRRFGKRRRSPRTNFPKTRSRSRKPITIWHIGSARRMRVWAKKIWLSNGLNAPFVWEMKTNRGMTTIRRSTPYATTNATNSF